MIKNNNLNNLSLKMSQEHLKDSFKHVYCDYKNVE